MLFGLYVHKNKLKAFNETLSYKKLSRRHRKEVAPEIFIEFPFRGFKLKDSDLIKMLSYTLLVIKINSRRSLD